MRGGGRVVVVGGGGRESHKHYIDEGVDFLAFSPTGRIALRSDIGPCPESVQRTQLSHMALGGGRCIDAVSLKSLLAIEVADMDCSYFRGVGAIASSRQSYEAHIRTRFNLIGN